jgi:hypothetical protein
MDGLSCLGKVRNIENFKMTSGYSRYMHSESNWVLTSVDYIKFIKNSWVWKIADILFAYFILT